jgi:hypothetical protein
MGILKNPIQTIKAAMGDLSALVSQKQQQREKLLQRLDLLHALPLPKSDILDSLNAVIDEGRADYTHRLGTQLGFYLKNNRGMDGLPNVPLLAPNSGKGYMDVIGSSIYGLFGEQIKAALAGIVADLDLPEPGPALSERRAEIERINKELSKIESELEELHAAAESAGVQLQGYRPTGKK